MAVARVSASVCLFLLFRNSPLSPIHPVIPYPSRYPLSIPLSPIHSVSSSNLDKPSTEYYLPSVVLHTPFLQRLENDVYIKNFCQEGLVVALE